MLVKKPTQLDSRKTPAPRPIRDRLLSKLMDAPALEPPAPDGSLNIPAPSKELLALMMELEAEADRLVEEMVRMIRDIPEYRKLKDEGMWSEIRQILRVNVPVFYNVVAECRQASPEELSAARYFARRRVHQGIPLRGHLTAYRNGMWLLWGELVKRVMNRPALQRELLLRAAWAFRHLDTISGAVTEAYYAEQEGRIRHRDRALRDLFDEIVAGAAPTEELRARAAAVDLHLDRDLTIAVAAPAGPKTPAKGVVLPSVAVSVALAEVLGIAVDQVVMVERSRELILIAPATMGGERVRTFRAKMSEVLAPTASAGLRVSVGLSGTVADVDGVRQGYKEAKRAIEIGHVLVEAELVHSYDDLVLHDVIDSGARPGQRLIGASLGPLLALGETGRRLVETLDAYFRAGANLKVAAGILDIHPNTLAYRMRQIHRLTGLDSNDPEQRLRVEIALRLLAMQRRHEEAAKADHPSSHAAASAARKAARPSEA